MIARDRDTDNNGTLEQRLYVMQDANWNITAITNSTGAVVERFQYDAYGKRTVLSATFVAASDTFAFNHGFAGEKADTVTGRVNFRNREYNVDLMRWTTMDPIGFAAGDMNWNQYVGAGPTGAVDPSGLDSSGDAVSSGAHRLNKAYMPSEMVHLHRCFSMRLHMGLQV